MAERFDWPPQGACGEWWLASSLEGSETSIRGLDGDLATWLAGPGAALGLPAPADFPVLLKFLDSADVLSVQVHPDDALAAQHGFRRGKTEAWYVISAEPGAGVFLGLDQDSSVSELFDAIAAGADDACVRQHLHYQPVEPGDTLFVDASTIHAIDGGLVLFEIQQNSDTTYRIHDWGRGREVHLDRARESSRDTGPVDPVRAATAPDAWSVLLDTPAFVLRHGRVSRTLGISPPHSFVTVTVLAGEGELISSHGGPIGPCGETSLPVRAGDTAFIRDAVDLRGHGLDVLLVEPPR